ncbi:MAG: hypothetical protein BroJett040_24760 [Oligoflexia bacterium]|nr:MAG: hypothetical protein BroJett040_24760 [Oligoflexia bacterium]
MIVPWLKGILGWNVSPLAWTLVALNVFVFVMTLEPAPWNKTRAFQNAESLYLTGHLYYQYRGGEGLPERDKLALLGASALRDIKFMNQAEKMEFKGDAIAIEKWKTDLVSFRETLSGRLTKIFGLSFDDERPLSMITYQFMHAGMIHLLSNMMMLIIFAVAVEAQLGGLLLIFVYLAGGVAGAYGFKILGQSTLAPMIGASGSLSALIAFYAVFEKKKRVSFFYFLSPFKGYYGWIYLPTYLIFPLLFVSDLAAYFGTSVEIGSGVAYTAHLGGMIFGIVFGLIMRVWKHYGGINFVFSSK